MISLIGTFITFGSLFWLALLMSKSKSREGISWLINHGEICNVCNEDIIRESDASHQLDVWESAKPTTCTACKRDQALSEVLDKKVFNPLTIVTSDRWRYIFLILCLSSVFLQASNLFFKSGYLGLLGGILLFLGQMGNYYNFMKTTRPKKTQSN
jgi:hypothetical protein